MLYVENINTKDMPEWLKKCMLCSHAYTTKNDDTEIKCRLKKGCRFESVKGKEGKRK